MTDDKPWLSLPDEEPPERGLAELMAAARVKAEVMAQRPRWMRWVPAISLAGVVVVLGGVLGARACVHSRTIRSCPETARPAP